MYGKLGSSTDMYSRHSDVSLSVRREPDHEPDEPGAQTFGRQYDFILLTLISEIVPIFFEYGGIRHCLQRLASPASSNICLPTTGSLLHFRHLLGGITYFLQRRSLGELRSFARACVTSRRRMPKYWELITRTWPETIKE